MFCFPISDHVMLLEGIASFKYHLMHEQHRVLGSSSTETVRNRATWSACAGTGFGTKFSNLSSEEWLALKNLSKRHDIVIKSADKGGAVVVWRSDLYREEALRQLSDTSFYAKVEKDLIVNNQKIAKDTIQNFIVKQELPATATNLIITTPRTSCIYFLPKIHKPNNPGRPIVSACSCPSELISSYLDEIMAPIVKSLPSYIKDSQHALEIFRDFNFLGQDKLIFTMDISSLYTVIPNSEGLLALKYFLDQRTVEEPSSDTLLRLAELV